MSNIVKFTMINVPASLTEMYIRVEEDTLSPTSRNILFQGVLPVTGDMVEVDIGTNGVVGDGVIVSADNFTNGSTPFKAMSGYSVIGSSVTPPQEDTFLDSAGRISSTSVINQNSEIWSII